MSADKRHIAGRALRRIAALIEAAPLTYGSRCTATADELLRALLESDFVTTRPDPTAEDGTVSYCVVCEGEPHSSSCPVEVLETLHAIGLDNARALPAHIGLDDVPGELPRCVQCRRAYALEPLCHYCAEGRVGESVI